MLSKCDKLRNCRIDLHKFYLKSNVKFKLHVTNFTNLINSSLLTYLKKTEGVKYVVYLNNPNHRVFPYYKYKNSI